MMSICIQIRCLFVLLCIVCVVGTESEFLSVGAIGRDDAIANGFSTLPIAWTETKYVIPSSFSIQLKRGISGSDLGLNQNRRLLNTEKLIFRTDSLDSLNGQDGMYVMVNVEPEGIVAIPNIQERENIVFNIVCDELLLGIPHKAWWVVVLVLLCLLLAFTVPKFLSPFLLPKNQKVSVS